MFTPVVRVVPDGYREPVLCQLTDLQSAICDATAVQSLPCKEYNG